MLRTHPTTPHICNREFLGYYDLGGVWNDHKTYVMTGFTEFRVSGDRRGDDLRVFQGRYDVTALLDAWVQTHADAVAWCRRMLGEPEESEAAA